ncbi:MULTISPECIES: hypothetical protein [Pseudoalteromonas]|uniref:hypothetical protein n=1 Tax=Pseudoalteromonas TaxID=53246 RepID=UPI001582C2CB|nr:MULTISPECIES: hypothetical protein [Pseudoalteromonas]MDI4652636.1 hypothetical protein [Pseudoalteromonas shioyasakiensis]NUJ38654.1 hypothetical protein [Pseudoalteromonas sp. 0303]
MSTELINVTRWVNKEQQFVDVGKLFRDDSRTNSKPLVGFKYNDDYLERYPPLMPGSLEQDKIKTVLLGRTSEHYSIPNYFKQFLCSERNKSVINALDANFNNYDQFQQLQHLTNYKGSFGAVQLNYDSETQANKLPNIDTAIDLLDKIESGEYSNLNSHDLNAMYHPNSGAHAVSTFLEVGDNYVHCTIRSCESEQKINEMLFVQKMMKATGIEPNVVIKIMKEGSRCYVGQLTGEQVINKKEGTALLFNTIPISSIMAEEGVLTRIEENSFAEVNRMYTKSLKGQGISVFKRALFTHLMGQKDLTDRTLKIKELGSGDWVIAPQEVYNIDLNPNRPYNMPVSDTLSAYTDIKFNDDFVSMAAHKFKLPEVEIKKVIVDISETFQHIHENAISSGMTVTEITPLKRHLDNTGLAAYAKKLINNEQSDEHSQKGPDLS